MSSKSNFLSLKLLESGTAVFLSSRTAAHIAEAAKEMNLATFRKAAAMQQ